MDAQSHIESAKPGAAAAGTAEAVEAAAPERDGMDELLATIEAELTLQGRSLDGYHDLASHELTSEEFEESIRHALDGLDPETAPSGEDAATDPAPAAAVPTVHLEMPDVETAMPEIELAATADRPPLVEDVPPAAPAIAATGPEAAIEADLGETLEAVELELALQNQNLVSLGFEDSIRTALADIGGEMLFQMRLEREDCQRIAAVRIGQGEEQQFALVIMPPGGGMMRVEPVEQSSNPLAMIAASYAGLVDTFRAAA
jgi:hypothetical protein